MEHASQVRNRGSQEMSTSPFSFPQRTREACTRPQKTSMHSTMIGLSLHQHLQQYDVPKEEASMQNFIMNRFLPAAKEVAAEHENFIASLASKNHSEAQSPSLPQHSRRTPITHCSKSRAEQAPKGFSPSRPLHSRHQEDGIPDSMRSCGFFCLGRKTAVSSAHRSVSASGRSTLRKQSLAPHPSNHLKAADKGTTLSAMLAVEWEGARKKKAMGGVTKHQSGINVDVPILHPLRSPNNANGEEGPRRHAIKYHGSFSRRGCRSLDGSTNVECNPSLSQSGNFNLAVNELKSMKSMQSSHADHVSARKFATTALKEQDSEPVQEGVTLRNQKRACHCESNCVYDHVKNLPPHDLAGENMSRSTLGGLETNCGKPAHDYAFRSAWQDGDDDEDDKTQFLEALSRDSSVKSNATFYTIDSPRSEFEVLGFEYEWVNDKLDFTDASSHFETPRASTSENKSALSHFCMANEKDMSGKMSSLSQRVCKGLKLETERKQAISPSKHDTCAYEQKREPQQTELQTRRFFRLRHRSLDSISDLYLSKASAISSMFPAKCQKNMPNTLGWPFGISSHQSSEVGGTPCHIQQERNSEKYVVGGNVPIPPLPPSPTEPWLGKAVTKNASKPSPLATLQQKEKVASASPLPPPSPAVPWLRNAVTKNASKTSPLATLQQKEKVTSVSRLPPSPTEPWLGKAVTKNASESSPLATSQQKEKVASASPLPPSPTEPWLGKYVTKNASESSPLATLLQKQKVVSRRKSAGFISMYPDAERRWEDVVKGSRVHREHWRYSEELEILMLTSL